MNDAATTAALAGTWLFVPGDRPERFDKAVASGADLMVLDLEDAVAPHDKDTARGQVVSWLDGATGVVAIRVNAAGTAWHDADVAALRQVGSGPHVVMLPKTEHPEQVATLIGVLPAGWSVAALIETARGVSRARDVADAPGVSRLVLGTYDLAAQLGVDPDHAPALAAARSEIVLASAIGGLTGPVDGVTGDVADADALAHDIEQASALGFTGKLCIHPRQIVPAVEALAPLPSQVAWAERVLEAARAATGGVTLLDGSMVDAPVVARAEGVLRQARR